MLADAFGLAWPHPLPPWQQEGIARLTQGSLLLADDMGFSDAGCYGGEISTPNLDRLAQEGVRFTQFYAGSTVCAPSRSVLMTGQHLGRTRVRGNAGGRNPLAQSLQASDVTVARVLRDVKG
jgi:arylsulfatase A-like enzyme